jgi:hypothetical protein
LGSEAGEASGERKVQTPFSLIVTVARGAMGSEVFDPIFSGLFFISDLWPNPIAVFEVILGIGGAAVIFFIPTDGVKQKLAVVGAAVMQGLWQRLYKGAVIGKWAKGLYSQ